MGGPAKYYPKGTEYKKPKRIGKPPSRHKRGYDNRWQKIRNNYIAKHPLCEHCVMYKKVTPAVDVDHIIPFVNLSDPRRLDWDNLQALCKSHHHIKTRKQQLDTIKMRNVVCGEPGAGKTTYVNKRKKIGDFVWDQDEIVKACCHVDPKISNPDFIILFTQMRNTIISTIHRLQVEGDIWIIITKENDAADIATLIGGRLIQIVDQQATILGSYPYKAGK